MKAGLLILVGMLSLLLVAGCARPEASEKAEAKKSLPVEQPLRLSPKKTSGERLVGLWEVVKHSNPYSPRVVCARRVGRTHRRRTADSTSPEGEGCCNATEESGRAYRWYLEESQTRKSAAAPADEDTDGIYKRREVHLPARRRGWNPRNKDR